MRDVDPDQERPPDDATRRTFLASERTFFAWFRSGLAALAVAITIGRVVPELTEGDKAVFQVVGLGFGLVGLAILAYGAIRERQVVRALERGEYVRFPTAVALGLSVVALVLGVALLALIWDW